MSSKKDVCKDIAESAKKVCKSMTGSVVKIPFIKDAAENAIGNICYKTADYICNKIYKDK